MDGLARVMGFQVGFLLFLCLWLDILVVMALTGWITLLWLAGWVSRME